MNTRFVFIGLFASLGAYAQTLATVNSASNSANSAPFKPPEFSAPVVRIDKKDQPPPQSLLQETLTHPTFHQIASNPDSLTQYCIVSTYSVEKESPPQVTAYIDFSQKALNYSKDAQDFREDISKITAQEFPSQDTHELVLFASQRNPFEKAHALPTRISARKRNSTSFFKQLFTFTQAPRKNADLVNHWEWVYLVKGEKCSALASWLSDDVLKVFSSLHESTGSGLP